MPAALRKAIKIVKRENREGEGSSYPERLPTEAQLRREIARVVVSWINDRKETQLTSIERVV